MKDNKRKKIFPMFKNNLDIIYLDNAALTFKPKSVIKKGVEFYEKFSISTRTADSKIGIKIANDLRNVRQKIANFVQSNENEVIFTQGTTDGLNQIASMLSRITNNGEIIFSYFNHSSAIVPFIENFKNKNIVFKYCEDENSILKSINKNTKILIIPQTTNNFQIKFDLKKIYKKCKKYNTILINDAAQAIAHTKVDFNYCDVLVFSSNKIYGPTGSGALIVKEDILSKLSPIKWGGGQVQDIYQTCSWNMRNSISKWEPGTLNFAGILQMGEALNFLNSFNIKKIQKYETEIANYAYDELLKIKNITIDSKRGDTIILFNINSVSSQDVASYLGNRNIYVRAGAFCAYKFKEVNNLSNSYVRISLALYNNKNDIDVLVETLKNGGNFIEIF
ncbi:aminotransferase class V-fold PLP-dependent enzyme [Metamycoplasma canadense]|nr:aminotransferase class V-fold PLP-dependent enzyme [Metamycoplasma canadense]